MSTLQHAIRYVITDRTQCAETEPERRAALIAQALRLATEGVDYIQLREKDLPAQDLIGLTREILSAIRVSRSGTHLLIHARADVALAAGAHGVHLPSGEDQLTPAQVRLLLSRHSEMERSEVEESPHSARTATGLQTGEALLIVSVSCHTLDEVRRAHERGADLILFGPVFGKSIAGKEVVPGIGLEVLKAACDVAGETPVLALGGVTAENAAATIAVGAKGIAAIRLFR